MFAHRNIRRVISVLECSYNNHHYHNLSLISTNYYYSTNPKTSSYHKQQQQQQSKRRKSKKKITNARNVINREEKLLRERLLMTGEETSHTHTYMNLYPWKSPEQLANHLKNTEVFNEDGLIALNKPYGIALTSSDGPGQTLIAMLNSGNAPDTLPSMKQVLPILQEEYNVPHLEVIKSTERWSSGLMLLCTSTKVRERVEKCLRRSKALSEPCCTYTGVALGVPKPTSANTKLGITLEYVPNIGKVPVITEKYSVNSARSGKVKPAAVRHALLHFSKEAGVSLFEIQTQVTKWHFLRVYSAFCYSPVLGDHMYSARVRTLASRRVLVSPHNITCEPQKLPRDLYDRLELSVKSSESVPCHLHFSRVSLCQYNEDNSPLLLSCPPPPHFIWTCRKLGLIKDGWEGEEGVGGSGSGV